MELKKIPMEVLYEKVVYPPLEAMKGNRFKIVHLKTERGKQLNSKIVTVIGFDRNQTKESPRLHCRIIEGEEEKEKGRSSSNNKNNNAKNKRAQTACLKIKNTNLIPADATLNSEALETFMAESAPISDDVLAQCLEQAIQKHSFETDRQDLSHRLGLYKNLHKKIRNERGTLQDTDYCFPCRAGSELLDDESNFGRIMKITQQACWGNEICDIRYIDRGLKGDNNTECSICREVLNDDTENVVLVTLPCLHVFHEACIVQWLGSDLGRQSWNCPSCRELVPHHFSDYCIQYEEQLQRRVDEYPLSGFCTKCMIMIMENNRHKELPMISG